ncbi:MAG: LLM class flavin-dependent oxidoreductase [Polyangiaceae bacterium]
MPVEGGSVPEALAQVGPMARHAEALGFSRYWVAEHHGMPGIASAATSIVIAEAGRATSTIRIGAGGIMLPNHAPLVIAEQFGTLDALFPGRVDLGLGRAPGSEQRVASALRRNLASSPDAFPRDVVELMRYFAGDGPVEAVPGTGADVAIWILGSSLFGAGLAAALGLPYAFASHFAPRALEAALTTYRRDFRETGVTPAPRVMLGFNVIAADTDDEAAFLASSLEQAFVAIRTGQPRRLPRPVEGYREGLGVMEQHLLAEVLSCSAIGGPDRVREAIGQFIARHQPDEIIFASMIHDAEARLRSLTIAAEAMQALNTSPG